jgi:hypothetical protein
MTTRRVKCEGSILWHNTSMIAVYNSIILKKAYPFIFLKVYATE